MFIILSVAGCLPYIDFEVDNNGEAIIFGTREEAETYAKENCAWEYRIIKW